MQIWKNCNENDFLFGLVDRPYPVKVAVPQPYPVHVPGKNE